MTRSARPRLAQSLCSEQHDALAGRDVASRAEIQRQWRALSRAHHRLLWQRKSRRVMARLQSLGCSIIRLLPDKDRDMLKAIRERAIIYRALHGKPRPLSAELDRVELLSLIEKLGLER